MSSLSDFAKNFKPKNNQNQEKEDIVEDLKKNFSQNQNADIDENIKKTFDKYQNMDQSELYNQLFFEANKLKQSGQFDYNSLYNSIKNMEAYISPEQMQNMLNLLQQLK